jgi:hypothetical protein
MHTDVEARLIALERRIRRLQGALAIVLSGVLLAGLIAWTDNHGPQDLRARSLTLVDEHGMPRVVLGAPIPEPANARIARAYGLIINDSAGSERFGVGYLETGSVVMGFDAPPGVGTGGNRERLTLSVNRDGLAEIRFLDSRSLVRAHINSQSNDDVRMFIYGERDGQEFTNAVSAYGDTVIARAP